VELIDTAEAKPSETPRGDVVVIGPRSLRLLRHGAAR
jgi:hypothetical protein